MSFTHAEKRCRIASTFSNIYDNTPVLFSFFPRVFIGKPVVLRDAVLDCRIKLILSLTTFLTHTRPEYLLLHSTTLLVATLLNNVVDITQMDYP
jgi:hypothetical protein